MQADGIRNLGVENPDRPHLKKDRIAGLNNVAGFQLLLLRELAAQVAELNETLKENALQARMLMDKAKTALLPPKEGDK
jgi:uncharacterized coiled-coil protein SlyX